MRFQHCLFDLYGTLVDIHTDENAPRLWQELAAWYTRQGAPYSAHALQQAYFETVERMEQGTAALRKDAHEAHPEIQIDTVFAAMFRAKNVPPGPDLLAATARLFRQCSTSYIRLYEGAQTLLRALHANGQKVWLLSNAQSLFTLPELETLGIDTLFDGIYLSSDYGCKKPDRRFFELPLREHAIDPATAIMVGNDPVCDIQGAQAAGLSTVYIHSNLSPAGALPAANYVLPVMDLARVQTILTEQVTVCKK